MRFLLADPLGFGFRVPSKHLTTFHEDLMPVAYMFQCQGGTQGGPGGPRGKPGGKLP